MSNTVDGLVRPDAAAHEGCPVRLKKRHLRTDKGVGGTVEWGLRDAAGSPLDFSGVVTACTAEGGEESLSSSETVTHVVKARFTPGDLAGCGGEVAEVTGTCWDISEGLVRFPLPESLADRAGLYRFQVALVDLATGRPVAVDGGLWSVEEGLWGDTTVTSGMPSLAEIRLHLRDHPEENELLLDVEFDDEEILGALAAPVRQWNEMPPPVGTWTCGAFPFRYHWRQAVVGELLRTAAHSYARNNLPVSHGGVQGNFKDKQAPYLQLSELYRQEWLAFVERKKVEINARGFYGSAGSDYGGCGW